MSDQNAEEITDSGLLSLMDVFSGADGGVGFVMLRSFIDSLKKQADEGDVAAVTLLKIHQDYVKLVRIATKGS